MKNINILIVDDDRTSIRLLEHVLKEYTTFKAFNIQDAKNVLSSEKIDILISDYRMPDGNGDELCRWTNENYPHIVKFIVTASSNVNDLLSKLHKNKHNIYYVLRKPLSRQIININIKNAMLYLKQQKTIHELQNNLNDWVWEVNLNNRYIYSSSKVKDILGYTPKEIIGKTPFDLMPEIERKRIKAFYSKTVKKEKSIDNLENINIHKNGSLVMLETNGAPTYDEENNLTGYRGVNRDITERKKNEIRFQRLAYHDNLTKLKNRRWFKEALEKSIEKNNKGLYLIFIDLDNFKQVNDAMGHSAGDELLKKAALRIQKCIRNNDKNFIARLGGDEFVIMLTDVNSLRDVCNIATRIKNGFIDSFNINGDETFITVSMGIASYPENGKDAETLLMNADTALYNAKETGKNDYKLYRSSMNENSFKNLKIANDLRYAIERDELELYYQPQMINGNIVSAEALLRWNRGKKGMTPPNDFIPIAETTGLIIPIGEWVIKQAFTQIKEWELKGFEPIKIAVNLSPRQLVASNLMLIICQTFSSLSIDPKFLELEITEISIMKQKEHIYTILEEFQKFGITIAIDDFGTGCSSLNYLKDLPFNVVKIDKSFVQEIGINKRSEALINSIMFIARQFNLKVVAEGVETKEQLEFLTTNVPIKIQGYYYSKPLPVKEFEKFLTKKTKEEK